MQLTKRTIAEFDGYEKQSVKINSGDISLTGLAGTKQQRHWPVQRRTSIPSRCDREHLKVSGVRADIQKQPDGFTDGRRQRWF